MQAALLQSIQKGIKLKETPLKDRIEPQVINTNKSAKLDTETINISKSTSFLDELNHKLNLSGSNRSIDRTSTVIDKGSIGSIVSDNATNNSFNHKSPSQDSVNDTVSIKHLAIDNESSRDPVNDSVSIDPLVINNLSIKPSVTDYTHSIVTNINKTEFKILPQMLNYRFPPLRKRNEPVNNLTIDTDLFRKKEVSQIGNVSSQDTDEYPQITDNHNYILRMMVREALLHS